MTEDDRHPEAQFPADRGAFEDPAEWRDRLPAPGVKAQELMAAHLGGVHGIGPFVLDRHVHLGGARPDQQHLTWDPGKATYHCDLCPGFVFATEPVTDEMIERTLLFNQGVQPLLAGPHSDDERREIARRHLSGELGGAVLALARREARRKRVADPRPTVERVVEEAIRMQRDDPAGWQRVCDLPRAASTLRRDWQRIPDERVEEAKRAFRQRS